MLDRDSGIVATPVGESPRPGRLAGDRGLRGRSPSCRTHPRHQKARQAPEVEDTADQKRVFSPLQQSPYVEIVRPVDRTLLAPSILPMGILFSSGDDDGAAGEVVHEVIKLQGCTLFDGRTYGDRDGLLSDESVQLTQATLCSLFERCGLSVLSQPERRIEALDCGNDVGSDTHTFGGSLTLIPGICGR